MTKQQPTGIEEIEKQIRKICISSSGDAYGSTISYSLTEEQFKKLFALFSTTRREAEKKLLDDMKSKMYLWHGTGHAMVDDYIKQFYKKGNHNE